MLPRAGRSRREAAGQRRAISGLDASTFSAGIRLLPSDLQHDIPQLYRMLRTVDDLVDERDPQASSRVQAIERWAQGQPAGSPEVSILNELSRRHALPRSALDEFCIGMRHDLAQTPITTEDDLERYCQYVGGSIGAVVASMLGISGPEALHKVAMLGRAFQRTNILRDIDEDHAHGRLYIAATTIERFGPPVPGAREQLLRDQITRADRLYEQGLGAIALLARGQRAMAVSAALYREILRQIERDGYGRQPGRAVLPAWRERMLIAQGGVE
jgi:15-cis-phytoene synthase